MFAPDFFCVTIGIPNAVRNLEQEKKIKSTLKLFFYKTDLYENIITFVEY